jgi:LPXTG-site transpeptidase (sortase) family protein
MRKPSLKLSLLILGVGGILFSFLVIFFLPLYVNGQGLSLKSDTTLLSQTSAYPPDSTSVQVASSIVSLQQLTSGLPIHLKIPKINVDADLESVGLTTEGAVAIPKGPTNPAWFDLGPRPGETGNAIIVGHFGWKDNIPAVFDDLDKLIKGDKLFVRDEKGVISTFVVSAIRTYEQSDTAPEVFISKDGKAHLNLITCSGVWNTLGKSYSTRLVVFTDKEITQ